MSSLVGSPFGGLTVSGHSPNQIHRSLWNFMAQMPAEMEGHHRPLVLSLRVFLKKCSQGSAGKESACSAGDLGLIPGLGRFPGEGRGYPLWYSGLENSMDCISPWGRKESDMTERLSLTKSSS